MLERGDVANSWRTERWDSLRLLTPNWQSRLPGHSYEGPDPDTYMHVGEVVEFIEKFAKLTGAPVVTEANVTSLRSRHDGYSVVSSRGEVHCQAVIIASGACNQPAVPAFADALPAAVDQLTPFDYRNPDHLAEGRVLVVGASATGLQLAAELLASGRPVTLSVGEHVRLPRTYRGRDVLWWMDAAGIWDQRYDEIDDLSRARRLPSPQLVGTSERRTLDLNALTDMGAELVGRWADVRDGRASSRAVCATCSPWPTSRWRVCSTRSTPGPRTTRATIWRPLSAWPRPACQKQPGGSLTCAAAKFARSCGPPVFDPIIGGWTWPSSTQKASYVTMAALSMHLGCMPWGFPFSAAENPPLSTGLKTTPVRWWTTWCGTWVPAAKSDLTRRRPFALGVASAGGKRCDLRRPRPPCPRPPWTC